MGLQFIFGPSGSGKSTLVYQNVIQKSMADFNKQFIIMVPDQFTMSTQKKLCNMHPNGGIMNIDVLSFSRLIYRMNDEIGTQERIFLDDTGKNLILRNVALKKEEELEVLKSKLKRPSYVHEVKSMISEFYQYGIGLSQLDEMIADCEKKGSLYYKLKDLRLLFESYEEYLQGHYITTEEALTGICEMIPRSKRLKNSCIVFDGFTGFTPIQYQVIRELMKVCDNLVVTLSADNRDDILGPDKQQKLFSLTWNTYHAIKKIADEEEIEIEDEVFLSNRPVYRYRDKEDLAFLEENLFRYQGKVWEKDVHAISIYEAANKADEVQKLCLEIKKHLKEGNYCYSDIAVVTGDLESYGHLVQREFTRFGIPFFMDQNMGVSGHPFTEYLVSALEMIKGHFSYETVFRFLRSGYSDITRDETDRLEVYVKSMGIRGKKSYERMFVRGENPQDMNLIREKFMEEIKPILGKMKTARDYITALYELCMTSNLEAKLKKSSTEFEEKGDMSKAKEYQKIYPAIMDLFDQIYDLMGEEEVSLGEFIEIFKAGISEIRIGSIPQTVDQVVVGDIQRSRLEGIKVLLFMGVNDGVIPKKGSGSGFLSELEREYLLSIGRELAPTQRQLIFQQRLYLYQNMTKPSDYLYISYSQIDESGKAILPSYLIQDIKELFPKLSVRKESFYEQNPLMRMDGLEDGLFDFANLLRSYMNLEVPVGSQQEQENVKQLLALSKLYEENTQGQKIVNAAKTTYQEQRLDKNLAKALFEGKGSISRLESFAKCAYAHFLMYGLSIQPMKEYEISNLDFGNVYHSALERIFLKLREEKKKLTELSEAEIRQYISETVDVISQDYGNVIFYDLARNVYHLKQIEKVLFRSLLTIQKQQRKGKFAPTYYEHHFRIEDEFTMTGVIDRVDLLPIEDKLYVMVVDYKSSEHGFDENELYYGLSLQLPLYLKAIQDKLQKEEGDVKVIPASMLYYHLNNPIVKEKDAKSDPEDTIVKEMRMKGLTVNIPEVIDGIDEDFEIESEVIRLKRLKAGNFDANSQVVEPQDMDNIIRYAQKKAKDLVDEIMDGKIAVNPVQVGSSETDSCSFCHYKSVCKYDPGIEGYEVKKLPKMKSEDAREAIKNGLND